MNWKNKTFPLEPKPFTHLRSSLPTPNFTRNSRGGGCYRLKIACQIMHRLHLPVKSCNNHPCLSYCFRFYMSDGVQLYKSNARCSLCVYIFSNRLCSAFALWLEEQFAWISVCCIRWEYQSAFTTKGHKPLQALAHYSSCGKDLRLLVCSPWVLLERQSVLILISCALSASITFVMFYFRREGGGVQWM